MLKKIIKKIFSNFFLILKKDVRKKIHNYITSEENSKRSINQKIFDSIFFEIRTKCNSKCSFCAASIQNEIRPDKTMDFNLFKKAINELSSLNYKGVIAFHVNNDPLIVKNIYDYTKYAREKCKESWIQILTNGRSLNNENGEKLLKSGINELSINVYFDQNDKKFKIPQNILNFENDILPKFYSKDKIKTSENNIILVDSNVAHMNKNKIFVYNKYKRLINIILTNRANSAPNKKTNSSPELGFCYFPFSQFNITVDGTVSHCCADFYFSNSMGNIKNQNLMEIWNGLKFKKIRENLKNNERKKEIMCSGCDNYGVNKPKNIIKNLLYKLTNAI